MRLLVVLPTPPPRTFEQRIQDQIAEDNKLHAVGLTAVRHPGGSIDDYRLRKELQKRGGLTMRVTQLLSVDQAGEPSPIEQAIALWGITPADGDPLLRAGLAGLATVEEEARPDDRDSDMSGR